MSEGDAVRYFYAYILICGDGSYYVGHTDDLDNRIAAHETGLGGDYTSTRLPVRLAWSGEFATRDQALAFEQQVKGWSRVKKEAVIRGDWESLPELSRSRAAASARTITLAHPADYDGWRAAARDLAAARVPPAAVSWVTGDCAADLFAAATAPAPLPASGSAPRASVPRRFLELAETVAAHADPERFHLLYLALTRILEARELAEDAADPLMYRLDQMAKAVRRDIHKMRAYVRFRHLPEGDRFVAWFEPEHHIVRMNAPFFTRRFAQMAWSILTPEECVHWDGTKLAFTPGATRADAPDGDPLEETWATYYAHIFNPARLKVAAMTREMPKKYWKNMPETALIGDLIAGAQQREQAMIDTSSKGEFLTPLAALALEASACERCPLYLPATQTVFGEGPADARLMFVGEQPGDQEDLAGKPFVGPAGQVFDRALAAAGIDRARTYVTNAVKHFKFEPRGKRRIHSKPGTGEIDACRWWIDAERAAIKPAVTVLLGATAARSLTGRTVTIGKERGRPFTLADGSEAWITVHPSFLLRIEDKAAAEDEFARFVADLTAVRARVAALGDGTADPIHRSS